MLQIKNKLIDSICTCISRTDTNSVNTVNDAQVMLTKCVEDNWDLYYSYIIILANQSGTLSQETVQKISKYIAAQIYAECPAMRIRVYHVQHQ
jgi:ferritin-like protein